MKTPAIRFHLLNLDIGGQTSSLVALYRALGGKGLLIQLPLQDLVNIQDKPQVERYIRRYGLFSRLAHFISGFRKADDSDIHHVMLPSPGWSWLAWIIQSLLPDRRFVFQFGGYSIGFNEPYSQVLKWAKKDPAFYVPRLVLNNALIAKFSPRHAVPYLVSTGMQSDELRSYEADPEMITIIPNVTDELSRKDKIEARNSLRLPETQFIFGSAGALSHVKGADVMLRSFELLSRKLNASRIHCAIAGRFYDPINRNLPSERFRRMLEGSSNLLSSMTTLSITDMELFLSAIDVLVVPYRTLISTNLQPSLILEALSIGTPILTTDVRPLDELADHGISIRKCTPENHIELASEMENAYYSFTEFEEQSKANMQKLWHGYFKGVADKYYDFYQKII